MGRRVAIEDTHCVATPPCSGRDAWVLARTLSSKKIMQPLQDVLGWIRRLETPHCLVYAECQVL